jgi:tetratricopeptide (TPR) repeat protein
MILSRLEQLQKFLDEDPADPFNWYALALEYQKTDINKALAIYEKLLTDNPKYVPTYYQAANLYQLNAETKKAINTYEVGIKQAQQQNDRKAAGELQSALDELMS